MPTPEFKSDLAVPRLDGAERPSGMREFSAAESVRVGGERGGPRAFDGGERGAQQIAAGVLAAQLRRLNQILALLLAGETWNVSSLIGLFGIAVQNGLVLVSQTKGLMAEGKPFPEAVREASIGRVRPKLMTAGTAILGLLPLLVLPLHGTEIERPLAVVMVGGLLTSTVFTLLALPTFYALVHGVQERVGQRRANRRNA